MKQITEKTPVVQQILNSERIDDLDKLIAISELLNLEQRVKNGEQVRDAYFNNPNFLETGDESSLISWFYWEDSELGHGFWNKIDDLLYEDTL